MQNNIFHVFNTLIQTVNENKYLFAKTNISQQTICVECEIPLCKGIINYDNLIFIEFCICTVVNSSSKDSEGYG